MVRCGKITHADLVFEKANSIVLAKRMKIGFASVLQLFGRKRRLRHIFVLFTETNSIQTKNGHPTTKAKVMDFQAIRKEYENRGIDESNLPENPIGLFREWFELAVEKCPGKWLEPNVMALATSDGQGNVTNRYVLLKHINDEGITFFTNYDSAKGRQIAANPRVAVAFHWPYLGRQIRIVGSVKKTSREVSEEYFHSRPRGSQIGAAASEQSKQVESRKVLDDARTKLENQLDEEQIPLPDNWGGYLLAPITFEFWQGRLDRLHDRIEYRFEESWKRTRLSP